MKKILSVLTCSLIILFQLVPAFADDSYVYDYAGLFGSDTSTLEQEAADFAGATGMDVVLLTTDDTSGKTSEDYADDFFYNNSRGTGDDRTGVLFLINMDEGEVWIYTHGKAIQYYTDARIEWMLDDCFDYAVNGDYYRCASEFLKSAQSYYDRGIPSNQYTVQEYTIGERFARSAMRIPLYIIGGAAIGGIVVGIMVASNKGKTTVNHQTYQDLAKFNLKNKSDRLVNVVHTHHRINTNTGGGSSGGGGGRSTVSSGRGGSSHGGGGRKF